MTSPSVDAAQWSTLAAVAAGVIGALSLAFVWRKARGLMLMAVLALALWLVWIRVGR